MGRPSSPDFPKSTIAAGPRTTHYAAQGRKANIVFSLEMEREKRGGWVLAATSGLQRRRLLGLRSGFESPDLDSPGRLPHQQGLCEARLGNQLEDGLSQLGCTLSGTHGPPGHAKKKCSWFNSSSPIPNRPRTVPPDQTPRFGAELRGREGPGRALAHTNVTAKDLKAHRWPSWACTADPVSRSLRWWIVTQSQSQPCRPTCIHRPRHRNRQPRCRR